MPTKKKKPTRTMTCKLCGVVGFNSRNCPTKTAPWTVLTQGELDNITKKLGIAVSEVSQAQIDFALSQRSVDFDGEILAHYYHNHKDRFELALKVADRKPEPTLSIENTVRPGDSIVVGDAEPQGDDKPTLSSQEQVALSVMSDVSEEDVSEEDVSEEDVSEEPTNYELIEDIRFKFGKELFFLSRDPSDQEEELEIGNSIFTPTFRADGSIHLQVMVTQIGYGKDKDTHTCMYEFDSIDDIDAEQIASDFIADYLGVVSDVEPGVEPASAFVNAEEDVSEEDEDTEDLEDQALFDDDELSEEELSEEELSFDDEDYVIDSIPEGALFVGFENNPTGFNVVFFDEDLGYLQGSKTIGFSFSAELSFDDAENVIKAMQGAVELTPVEVSDLKMLKFMRPDAIPFQMWEDIELELTSKGFTDEWLVPQNMDIESIFVGAKIDPIGRRWRVQAVCLD